MKSREQKQKDLNALTERLNNSKSAMVVSFNKVTVNKDQEFRNQLRAVGAEYQVVKNTLARLAVEGTQYDQAKDAFKGVSAIAWTESDPVLLSKAVSKFIKDNADFFTFKAGVVDGKVVDLKQVEAIASLPSKEELIGKFLYVLNAPAQRLATVLNAVPRNLAIALGQIAEGKGELKAPEAEAKVETTETAATEAKPEEAKVEVTIKETAETTPPEEAKAETSEETAGTEAAPTEVDNAEEAKAEDSEEKSEE